MIELPAAADGTELSWYSASAQGNGVGLTVLSDGPSRSVLMIHVLPKLWRGPGIPQYIQAPVGGGAIEVFEGDRVGFPPVWAARMETVAVSGESSSPLDDDRDAGPGDRLWAPAPRSRQGEPPVPQPELRAALWDLLFRHHQQIAPVRGSVSDFGAAAGIFASLPELRPLLQSVFVDLAVAAIPHRKPVYREVVESLGVVRGRILAAPLVRRQATRSMRVVCEYETLTGDDDLWRAVKTALSAATEAISRSDQIREAMIRLEDVGSIPAAAVLSRAKRGFSSQNPKLNELYGLAIAVLRSESRHSGDSVTASGVAINLKFVTSDLWEQLLDQAFRSTGAVVSHPGLPVFYRRETPHWFASTVKAPDLVVSPPGGGKIIIDAKYMNASSLSVAPMSAQYQIATYALRSGAPAFLAFSAPPGESSPASAQAEVARVPALWDEWESRRIDAAATRPSAVVGSFCFPFPAPGDASHMDRLVSQAHRFIAFVTEARDPSEAPGP